MGAFPDLFGPIDHPIHITSFGPQATAGVFSFNSAPATNSPLVASTGIFVPFRIAYPFLCLNLWCQNGAAVAGTFDIGIYSRSVEKLVSAGSTTQAGTSAPQKVTLGTPLLLPPGTYYMAMSVSTVTTCKYFIALPTLLASLQLGGLAQAATQTPLAQTPTLVSLANSWIPLFGLGGRTLI